MKTRLKQIALLFGILLVQSVTVYAQSGSRNTCDKIHYTDEMDKACQECWENDAERQGKYVEALRKANINDSLRNIEFNDKQAVSDTLVKVRIDNTTLKKKVKRNRRVAICGVSGFVATLVLLFTIK